MYDQTCNQVLRLQIIMYHTSMYINIIILLLGLHLETNQLFKRIDKNFKVLDKKFC